jgi:NADPH:quinone reductase-like Zn-dependent oxidoreductase
MCSPANFDLIKSLGADQVFDYATADFNTLANTYDIVFDAVGKSPFAASVKSLKPTGYYLRMVHMAPAPILKGLWVNATTRKKVIGGVAKETVEGLELFNKMILEGKLKPVIDRIYAFDQVVAAHAYVEQGHKKGNVIMRIREDATAV